MPDAPPAVRGVSPPGVRNPRPDVHDPVYGRRFWIGVVVGGGIMLHGLAGLLRQASVTRPGAWAVWLLAILAAHDLVLVPAVLLFGGLLGVALGGVAGQRLWPPLRAGLVIAGIVLLVTMPALVGGGRSTDPTNPTLLPNHYPLSLALVIGLILAVAGTGAGIAVRRWRRGARTRPRSSAAAGGDRRR
jgi:hypothetical protein